MYLASSLPHMMIEHLLIFPCNPLINNQYWYTFDCSIPFTQDQVMYAKPRRCKNNMLKFKNMNVPTNHLKKHKCNHHIIVHKYLNLNL